MSDIRGSGYGDNHKWKKCYTPQVGSAPNNQRYTYYECRECGFVFIHYYNITPNIFKAMNDVNVPAECIKKETT